MINLKKLSDEEFIFSTGASFCATWEATYNCLCLTSEIETCRRALEDNDFPQIESFIEKLIHDYYIPDHHFSHETTLVSLAIILAEYETIVSAKFFTEVEALHARGGVQGMPIFIRVGNYLAKLRDKLSPLKNKIRLKHSKAVFLPINELDEMFKETINKKLAIAAEVYEKHVTLVMHDHSEIDIQKSDLDHPSRKVDFSRPYLTDWGQTLGFGNFGDYEIDITRFVN